MALGSRAVSDFLICSTYATGLRMTSLPPTSCKRTAATQISNHAIAFSKIATASARLAQPAERKALNLVVVGSRCIAHVEGNARKRKGIGELARMLCVYFRCVCFPNAHTQPSRSPPIRGRATLHAELEPTTKRAERRVKLRHSVVPERICRHFEPFSDDGLQQHWQRAIL